MNGAADPYNQSVDAVFRDFMGRRAGIINALTTDADGFFEKFDPEKENLGLYGFPNEQWEVNVPADEVPPRIPEPVLGINFAKDGVPVKDWLLLVAAPPFTLGLDLILIGLIGLKNTPSQPTRRVKKRECKRRMVNKKTQYVVNARITTQQMNSGFAVTFARPSSMAIV